MASEEQSARQTTTSSNTSRLSARFNHRHVLACVGRSHDQTREESSGAVMPQRCTGHCCERFTIPGESYESLRDIYTQWQTAGCPPTANSIDILFTMLKKVGISDVRNNGLRLEAPVQWYTCKHYDRARHLCTIYDVRPLMCRAYPNGEPCTYAGCTMVDPTEEMVPKLRLKERS